MLRPTTALANAIGTALKNNLDGGFLYLYAGAVPATGDEPLDMVAAHTELVKISVDGDGLTGLTFDAPAEGVLSKAAAEVWQGTAAFSGFEAVTPTLAPTFYRFCKAGDDGRGAADASTGHRMQGEIGAAADLTLPSATITDGDNQPIGTFRYRVLGG